MLSALSCEGCTSKLESSCECSVFAYAGIESFSKLGDSIYFEEKADTPALSIIQYIPSTFNWKTAGVTVTQELEPLSSSDMNLQVSLSFSGKVILLEFFGMKFISEHAKVSLLIFVQNGQSATLNVRIPTWTSASGAKAALNGKDLGSVTPGIIV